MLLRLHFFKKAKLVNYTSIHQKFAMANKLWLWFWFISGLLLNIQLDLVWKNQLQTKTKQCSCLYVHFHFHKNTHRAVSSSSKSIEANPQTFHTWKSYELHQGTADCFRGIYHQQPPLLDLTHSGNVSSRARENRRGIRVEADLIHP